MDLSAETTAYAAYRNGLARAQAELEPDELQDYLKDLAKAEAAVFAAWLERGVGGALTADGNAEPPLARPTFGPVETIGLTTSDGVW